MNFNLATELEIIVELSQRLKKRRLLKNMTQKELASAAGVGDSTIQRFESGHSISLEAFLRIVMALGLINELAPLFTQQFSSISQLEQHAQLADKQRVRKANKRSLL